MVPAVVLVHVQGTELGTATAQEPISGSTFVLSQKSDRVPFVHVPNAEKLEDRVPSAVLKVGEDHQHFVDLVPCEQVNVIWGWLLVSLVDL